VKTLWNFSEHSVEQHFCHFVRKPWTVNLKLCAVIFVTLVHWECDLLVPDPSRWFVGRDGVHHPGGPSIQFFQNKKSRNSGSPIFICASATCNVSTFGVKANMKLFWNCPVPFVSCEGFWRLSIQTPASQRLPKAVATSGESLKIGWGSGWVVLPAATSNSVMIHSSAVMCLFSMVCQNVCYSDDIQVVWFLTVCSTSVCNSSNWEKDKEDYDHSFKKLLLSVLFQLISSLSFNPSHAM